MSAHLRIADSSRQLPASEHAVCSSSVELQRVGPVLDQMLLRLTEVERALALLRFPMPLPLLKTSEAAKVLKVSEASVRRWIEAGHLKASYFDLGGKRVYRIAQADLQAFVEGNAAANGRELGASIDLGFIEIPDMGT